MYQPGHSCTAALARRSFSTPRHVACGRIGSTQSAKTLIGGMPNKRLESHPYCFGICRGTAHSARLLEKLFVDVKRLLHTDDLAISFHAKQPYSPTNCFNALTWIWVAVAAPHFDHFHQLRRITTH